GAERRLVSRQAVPACAGAHLPVPRGNQHYVAQLEEAGSPIAVSNVVYTPPEGPSELEDRPWLTRHSLRQAAWGGAGAPPGLDGRAAAPTRQGEPSAPTRWM